MLLRLIAINSQNQSINFEFNVDQLEQGFDILDLIVANGEKLISIQLIDEKQVIDLPVESFDGNSSMEQIADLQIEWQSILAKPQLTLNELQTSLLNLVKQRLAVCEGQISRIEPMLSRLEALLLHSHEMNISSEARQVLEKNYLNIISLYQGQLDKAFITHRHLLNLVYRLS